MAELLFTCVDVRPDRYALTPILLFRLRIEETSGDPVNAIALRCQIRVEPQKRRYSEGEQERLTDLFGDRGRWAETLKPMQLTYVSHMVPAFTDVIDVDLAVPFSYDLEVASGKYFQALDDGEIPLLLLFNGSVFSKGATGYTVQQVPWHVEASYRLPVAVWQELMDIHFPGTGWLRLRRDILDHLLRFKAHRALATWDETVEALLKEAGE